MSGISRQHQEGPPTKNPGCLNRAEDGLGMFRFWTPLPAKVSLYLPVYNL